MSLTDYLQIGFHLSIIGIIVQTYRFILNRKSIESFKKDPSIKKVQIGKERYMERFNDEWIKKPSSKDEGNH